jgi:hypothetical protein
VAVAVEEARGSSSKSRIVSFFLFRFFVVPIDIDVEPVVREEEATALSECEAVDEGEGSDDGADIDVTDEAEAAHILHEIFSIRSPCWMCEGYLVNTVEPSQGGASGGKVK